MRAIHLVCVVLAASGPVSSAPADSTAAAGMLPAGPGRTVVEARCLGCHDATRLGSPGRTRTGWTNVLNQMMNIGVVLEPSEVRAATDYLAAHYPEQARTAARIVPGEVQLTFAEWAVATKDAFPHDPLATRDGAIWYAGQRRSLLGRIDPKTGSITEFATRVPDSGPHGLTADVAGNIWFTANYAGYIGRLDPKTGSFTEYKLPDTRARDPHTPVFDQKGVLWFTVQGANRIGRLRPASGEVRLVAVPTSRALPYGIVVSSAGVPFFAEFGTHQIASIDPDTMVIREYALPNPDSRPRRIAMTSDDRIWYSDYARGFLGSFDPISGAAREWASPGGPKSQPYGITVLNDIIWYSESNVEPNTLVRFDPRSEKFQVWPIPSGGGVVRNMMPTADGGLVLAESGAGKIALVTIK